MEAKKKKCGCGCGEELEKGLRKYKHESCRDRAKKARDKKKNSVQLGTTKRLTSYKTLKTKAWDCFSLYIRLKYSDENGMVKCVTCGKHSHYRDGMQAGHFVDGRGNMVLFNEELVFPQCYGCNCGKKGNKLYYTLFMMNDQGHSKERIEEMVNLKWKEKKISISEMKEIYLHYKDMAGIEMRRVHG